MNTIRFQEKQYSQTMSESDSLAPAGFWLRVFAYLYDQLFMTLITVAIYLLMIAVGLAYIFQNMADLKSVSATSLMFMSSTARASAIGLLILGSLLPWILNVSYFVFFESSRLRATPGKLLLGLLVSDHNGRSASFGACLKRNLMKWISGYVACAAIAFLIASAFAHTLGALTMFVVGLSLLTCPLIFAYGHILAAFGEHKQALHDRMSDCYVEKKLNFSPIQRAVFSALASTALVAIPIATIYLWLTQEVNPAHFSNQKNMEFKFDKLSHGIARTQEASKIPALPPNYSIAITPPKATGIPAPFVSTGTLTVNDTLWKVTSAEAHITEGGDVIEILVKGTATQLGESKQFARIRLAFKPFSKLCNSFSLRRFGLGIQGTNGQPITILQDTALDGSSFIRIRSCEKNVGGRLSLTFAGKRVSENLNWNFDIVTQLH